MRAAKVQASLRIRAVSPEPPLLAHKSSESRGTFRQKARSLAPLNVWACAVKICHDGMLEDTNSLGGAHLLIMRRLMKNATSLIEIFTDNDRTAIDQNPIEQSNERGLHRKILHCIYTSRMLIIVYLIMWGSKEVPLEVRKCNLVPSCKKGYIGYAC